MSTKKGHACRQAGFIPILIVILVTAALLGGYFVYQKSTNKPTNSPEPYLLSTEAPAKAENPTTPAPSLQPSPLSTKAPAKAEDPTANWKTYTYPLRFFSFKIPNDFVEDGRSKNPAMLYNYNPDKPIQPGESAFKLEIYIDTIPMDLNTYIADTKRRTLELRGENVIRNWRETKITVGGKTAIKVEYEYPGIAPGFEVYIQDPSETVIIGLSFYVFGQQQVDLANQILATFKFTQ